MGMPFCALERGAYNMTLAFNTRHPHVCRDSRWIVSLSDGTTVFEDKTPGEPAAWKRLRNYIRANSLKITNVRLEAYGQAVTCVSAKDGAEGYWHMNAIAAISGVSETMSRGIGYVKDGDIHIVWLKDNGEAVPEIRPANNEDIGLILNEV
jgi:hypothetical protein